MSRTRTERESNQKAVVALVALMGGPEGYRSRGLSLQDFKPIFEAEPNDDLSGLRLIADRMFPSLPKDKPLPDEPLLSPDIAEYWLIKDRRVRKREGILILDGTDHLSRAGFMIALGMKPQMLSEVYSQVSDNEQPIKAWVMGSISKEVIADYKARKAKS